MGHLGREAAQLTAPVLIHMGSASEAWWEELKQKAAQLGRTEEHIMPLGRPEYDSEDEDQPNLAQLRTVPVVVCPKPAEASYAALMEELGMVGR